MKDLFNRTKKYLLFLIAIFYIFAAIFTYEQRFAWFNLLILIYPVSIVAASFFQTYKVGFETPLFLYAPTIFLPVLLFTLNKSPIGFIFLYALATVIGQFLGLWLAQIRPLK